jgi:transcriptional repressor NrdR
MRELSKLDQVAYVRFASVYKRFEDVQAFRDVIESLEREAPGDGDRRQISLLDRKK